MDLSLVRTSDVGRLLEIDKHPRVVLFVRLHAVRVLEDAVDDVASTGRSL